MASVFIIGLMLGLGYVLWKKKFLWQSHNPFLYVCLTFALGLAGVMLVPQMPDFLVPDFLENWAYIDAFKDGPGGMSHMLFFGTVLILFILGAIIFRLVTGLIRGQKSSIAYFVVFAIAVLYLSGGLGMNLSAMKVNTADILGRQVTPVAQQAVVSTMNAGGTFLNELGQGFQAQEIAAPQHVVNRAGSHVQSTRIADLPTFKPWELQKESEQQSSVPKAYEAIPNDVSVGSRSSELDNMQDEDYNPADFEPAVERSSGTSNGNYSGGESSADFWKEVQEDASDNDKKKEKKKDDRPPIRRYRSNNGPTP